MFLEIENISVMLAGNPVLRNVSFTVDKKEVLVIVGRNGCGKSTLLQVIAGIRKPDHGTVRISGRDMIGVEPAHNPARLLPPFPQHLKVGQLVGYELKRVHGVYGRNLILFVKEALQKVFLDEVDIGQLMSRRKDQLSTGERRKVRLAAMLAARSKNTELAIQLFDEPTDAVDALTRQALSVEIVDAALQYSNGAVLYVTHDREEAVHLSRYGRIMVMCDGRVCQIGSLHEIVHNPVNKYVGEYFRDWLQRLGAISSDLHVKRKEVGHVPKS